MPGETCIDAPVQRVSLIVIDRRESRRYIERAGGSDETRTDQASRNWRCRLRNLIGIDKVELGAMPNRGGAQ